MKAKRPGVKPLAAVPAALLTLLLSAPLLMAVTFQKPALSRKQVKALTKSAKSREDHQKLALYYRQRARSLREKSQPHEEMAAAYANRTVFEPKSSFPGGRLGHCRFFAEFFAGKAKEADALAEVHENLAKDLAR